MNPVRMNPVRVTRVIRPGSTLRAAALGLALSAAAGLAPGVPLPAQAATESRIGVASAINPDAEGAPPGGMRRVLHVGIDIQADERVTTSANGQAQLLFLDGSAMSIGPNSDLVLDRFVYDPGEQTGELAVRLGRGVLRIVGGRISKKKAITVETVSATMGIRGGIGTFEVGESGDVTAGFLFGDGLSVTSGGVTRSTDIPGTVIETRPGTPPEPPRIMTSTEVTTTLAVFEGRTPAPETAEAGSDGQGGGQSGGQSGGRGGAQAGGQRGTGTAGAADDPDGALQRSGLSGESGDDGAAPPPGDPRGSPGIHLTTAEDRQEIRFEAVTLSDSDADEQDSVEDGTEGGADIAEEVTETDTGLETDGGGGSVPEDVADDTVEEQPADSDAVARADKGRLMLTPVISAFDPDTGVATWSAANAPGLGSVAEVGSDFAVATATGGSYRFPLQVNGVEYGISDAGSTAPLADFSGRMLVTSDDSFWRIGGRGTAGSASEGRDFVLFGGTQTTLSGIPVTGRTALAVGGLFDPLPFEGGAVPFGSAASGVALSPLYLSYSPGISAADRADGLTPPVGYQVSLMIDGTGSAQRSLMTGMILTIVEEGAAGSGYPALAGTLVGSRRDSATGAPVSLTGPVASTGLDRDEGSALFGSTGQYAVLDPSALSLDTASGTVARADSAVSAASLDGAAATGEWFTLTVQPGADLPPDYATVRTTRLMRGFTGGIGAARDAEGNLSAFTLLNDPGEIAPGGILVNTDAASGRVRAELRIARQDLGGTRTLQLGGEGSIVATRPTSAFIDNGRYIARDAGMLARTDAGVQATSQALLLVTGQSVDPADLWPDLRTCTCEYLDWGFWSGATTWPDGTEERYHMASWVAGELPELVEIPGSGTGAYAGQMLGGVIDGAQRYIASGDMNVSWNFGTRSGSMQVSGFDSADFAGSLTSTDGRQVTGVAESVAAVRSMNVDGSFFKGGADPVAAMGGSFSVQGQNGYAGAGTWMLDRQ